MKTCRYGCCVDWRGYRAKAKDFRQGAVEASDFDENFKPRKRGRRKNKKTCAKSKTGEACDKTGTVLVDYWGTTTYTCSRCGRHVEYKWDRLWTRT